MWDDFQLTVVNQALTMQLAAVSHQAQKII